MKKQTKTTSQLLVKRRLKEKMKKYMTFGILSLFAIAMVSAGLVNYLSNTTEVEVSVDSPLTLVTADIAPVSSYGGETVEIYTTITSHIEEDIYGMYTMVITNNLNNVGCSDFESFGLIIQNGSDAGTYTLSEVSGDCTDDGMTAIVSIPVMYLPNEVQSYVGLMEFAQNVEPADYSFESTVLVLEP